jgi:hypothetical protein
MFIPYRLYLFLGYVNNIEIVGTYVSTFTTAVFFFCRAEWDQTYKQIYSDDTVAQVKGFERLLVWKARCGYCM